MSVWVVAPSARPAAEVDKRFDLWRAQGYKVALWRDVGSEPVKADEVFLDVTGPYPGYAVTANTMLLSLLQSDPSADWFVVAADDIDPDLAHTADRIAAQCSQDFRGTLGVMQPIGDRWGEFEPCAVAAYPEGRRAYIERVAGSPWIGREFAERAYGGRGPYWPEYRHMFVDEELQAVAEKLGVFRQGRDLIHYHDHWSRRRGGNPADMPAFLAVANSPEHWKASKAIFEARKAAGFPGSELL